MLITETRPGYSVRKGAMFVSNALLPESLFERYDQRIHAKEVSKGVE
jgi:hypothetical protein